MPCYDMLLLAEVSPNHSCCATLKETTTARNRVQEKGGFEVLDPRNLRAGPEPSEARRGSNQVDHLTMS
jgi:hypothetical protein